MRTQYSDKDALLIHLNFPIGSLDDPKKFDAVIDFQDILTEVLEAYEVGYCDGNEFCESPQETSVTFFLYGSSANILYTTIEPLLHFLPRLAGSYVLKKFVTNNSEEKQIYL